MTDENAPIESAPEVLTDQDNGATPLRHQPEQKAPEPPPSASDAIKAAMAKVEADSKEPEPEKAENSQKAEKEPNEETKAALKEAEDKRKVKEVAPAEADKAGESEAEKASQSEGKHVKAPSRLLPSERDVWVNTPRAVQGAFERIEREFEEASVKHKEATEFHESLRQYSDMAKGANTTVKDALDRYVNADKLLAQDFGKGLAHIAQSHGKNPVEAVAQFMRAAGVQPQQLGAYLNGQPAQQPQQPARQADPVAQAALQRVQQLEQVIQQQQQAQQLEQERRETESAYVSFIKPYEDQYGEQWEEMRPWVAKYYQSDIIDPSLSPDIRLRESVYEAERKIAPLYKATAADADLDDKPPAPVGKKSISGSPGKSSTSSGKPKIIPIRDAIAAAMRNA